MSVTRVGDASTFTLLTERAGRLQVSLRSLQEQIATGRRLLTPDGDPLAAGQLVRAGTSLAALAQYEESARFGADVLGAQDEALAEANDALVRAEELATQQANGTISAAEREAAAEEAHGLLQAVVALGNGEFAGRRLFGGLALDGAPPFTAAGVWQGSTIEVEAKIGGGAGDRVRVSTRGDTVFAGAIAALQALETALRTDGDVAATIDQLAAGRAEVAAERASVGTRQAQLLGRATQVQGLEAQEQGARSRLRDADLVAVVSELTQVQTALQAVLGAAASLARTSLTTLLSL
jgi:flagellar hook-associated protein 3 FlgL